MRKKMLLILIAGVAGIFVATGIYAGTKAADVIKMENKAYKKHKKGIVDFTHKKHVEDYEIGCGDCHHDDKGKALDKLKCGDEVQGCIECHKKPERITKTAAEKMGLTDAQIREYHANALHDNCIKCHKEFNKGKKTKPAPASCGKCHPKKKKK